MAAALLEVIDLHAGYGRAEVLTGLHLRLAQKQVVSVIGPNGAGKSTTLAALMGILPCRGRVIFDGHDLATRTLEERVMMGLALVPEKRELFGTMPVQDNLILGGYRSMKLRVPHWQREIERVYDLFPRLKDRRTQLAGTLSGGERQMLALGRALMSAPKLLMLDEPSLGLAPLVVRDIFTHHRAAARARHQHPADRAERTRRAGGVRPRLRARDRQHRARRSGRATGWRPAGHRHVPGQPAGVTAPGGRARGAVRQARMPANCSAPARAAHGTADVACPEGLEPPTPSLEGWCSIQLSYGQQACCGRADFRRGAHAAGCPARWSAAAANL